jgi:putative chitinase
MTPSQLAKATGARIDRATEWLSYIEAAMQEFGIDTKQRQAMFLAQIGHESGGLHYTLEIWGPTPSQSRYEGRKDLGNTVDGDGFRCRGWGLIQTTGRYNLTAVGNALGFDAINDEAARADYRNIARAAAYFWKNHGLNRFADADDCTGCTRVINGGTNGLPQRLALYEAAKLALPEIVEATTETVTEAIQETPKAAPTILTLIMAVFKFFAGLGKKT